jgi:transmembrane sensor
MKLSPEQCDEAAAWFSVLHRGVMSIEERAAFEVWRAEPCNAAALTAAQDLWGEMAALDETKVPIVQPALRRRQFFMAAAASAAVVTVGVVSFNTLRPEPVQNIATGVGEQRMVALPDGSAVTMNVVTRVGYRMRPDRREISLHDGQALFVVHKDAKRPFLVRAGDYEVRAVGTAFDVRQRDGETEVAVLEGVVSVRAVDGPDAGRVLARLSAGQKLNLSASRAAAPEAVPVSTVAEWRQRTVNYEAAPVRDMVADLNRFFPRPIEIADPALGARRVTLRLQVDDREQALKTLAGLLDVPVTRGDRSDVLGAPAAKVAPTG